LGNYKKTRNNLDGEDFSSKLSPWFASGSLSARLAYYKTLEKLEQF
jgi:deoxyribodipyrimidine photo-lyase